MTSVLALVAVFFFSVPAAADNPFVVSGVHVDASGPSASAAQLAAIAQGRPRAWGILFRRIARPQDVAHQPMPDSATLERMILNFTVSGERRSTTRFVADVTYTFSPEGVQRVMQQAGLPFTYVPPKRILLVPYSPSYTTSSLWTSAFSGTRYNASAVPFALPGAGSQPVLGALSFDDTNWADVEPFATRIRATEAALVMVSPGVGHLTITIKRVGAGELPTSTSFDVPMLPGGAAGTYSSAADATVRAMEEMWKHPAEIAPTGRLSVDVRMDSLRQWGSLQASLGTVPNVTGIAVNALDIGEADVTINYLGTIDQLRDALNDHGLVLARSGGGWTLAASSTP